MRFLTPISDAARPTGRNFRFEKVWTNVYRLKDDEWLPVECSDASELKSLQQACGSRARISPPLQTRRCGLTLYIRPKPPKPKKKKKIKCFHATL